MEHDVGEQVHGLGQVFAKDRGIKDGVFLGGESVELAPHPFQPVHNLHGRAPPGALESGVLAEVRQPFATPRFMARPNGNGIAAKHHGRRGGQVDDAEPIPQNMRIVTFQSHDIPAFACKD